MTNRFLKNCVSQVGRELGTSRSTEWLVLNVSSTDWANSEYGEMFFHNICYMLLPHAKGAAASTAARDQYTTRGWQGIYYKTYHRGYE